MVCERDGLNHVLFMRTEETMHFANCRSTRLYATVHIGVRQLTSAGNTYLPMGNLQEVLTSPNKFCLWTRTHEPMTIILTVLIGCYPALPAHFQKY